MRKLNKIYEKMFQLGCMDESHTEELIEMLNKHLHCNEWFVLNLTENSLNESSINPQECEKVKQMIDSNKFWVKDDYVSFVQSLSKSKHKAFLTPYTPEDLKNGNYHTFQLKGYNIGFALHKDDDGVDIVAVHNNENDNGIGGIVDNLIRSAKSMGGNKLDHYDGVLSDFYKRNGFEEYDRWTFDPQYASPEWDYERFGTPDVVLRRLNNGNK